MMWLLLLVAGVLADSYSEHLSLLPIGEDYAFVRFEFNYSYGVGERLVQYLPSDLLNFFQQTQFEHVKLDFGLGRWKEAISTKIEPAGKEKGKVYTVKDFDTYDPGAILEISTPS
jgi:hypothetical protein